jgi:hypothetical protein
MPEGPEVRKYADALHVALSGRAIVSLEARTRDARKWLHDNEQRLKGRRVERVVSHGKHLLGYIEGDFFFHSHLMMWGRWQTFGIEVPEKDRRERARILVNGGAAILLSAPIFNVGEGDPYDKIEILNTLGPDALPYRGRFNRVEFLRRLREHEDEAIGATLLKPAYRRRTRELPARRSSFRLQTKSVAYRRRAHATQSELFGENNSAADTRCIRAWRNGGRRRSQTNGERSVAGLSAGTRLRHAAHGLSSHESAVFAMW